MGRPKVTERKKTKKKTNAGYRETVHDKNQNGNTYTFDCIILPTEKVTDYLTSEGKNIFSPESIKRYRDFLSSYNQKPSQNIEDYSKVDNSYYFQLFSMFTLTHKEYFTEPMNLVATKFKYERTRENFNKTLVYLWVILGFAACQIDE